VVTVSFVFLFSCEDTTYKEYTGNAPLYLTYDELRNAVELKEDVPLQNPGKIYFKDDYIFIIEELKGIHVFNNSDPSSPRQITYINMPGVIDMVISGNYLYADSYVDLVVIDLADIDNIHEAGRLKNILPYTLPPVDNEYPVTNVDQDEGLVIGWEVKTIRERVYKEPPVVYPYYEINKLYGAVPFFSMASSSGSDTQTGLSSNGIGIGGSMARFGIKENTLYLMANGNISLYDISTKTAPGKLFDVYAGWNTETMFLTENNMFLGTTSGMIIYDITNPQQLVWKSSFSHIRSCDPVVVDDTLAYATLRSGNDCGNTVNRLDIVNISDLTHPVFVCSYSMSNPHGLGKDGDLLFICDGTAGLKIYDASDPERLAYTLITAYPAIDAYDVIPVNNVLVMIGDDGLFQYDYTDIQNISLLSKIEVETQEE